MFKALLFASVAAVGCGGFDSDDEDSVTRQCERLRAHIIDLRLATANDVDREAHRTALTAALGTSFVADCQSKLTAVHRKCLLTARDTEELGACTAHPSPATTNP